MVGEVVTVRVLVPAMRTQQFWEAYREVATAMKSVDGTLGVSLWSDLAQPESFVVVFEGANEAAAQTAISCAISSAAFMGFSEPTIGADSYRWIHVRDVDGPLISEMPEGSYLSASLRVSEPGRDRELADDYRWVFDNLAVIPGYAGSLYGSINRINEHFLGLVWWYAREAFNASLPKKSPYELKLFRRVTDREMQTEQTGANLN